MALKEIVPGKLWEYENFLTSEEISQILTPIAALGEDAWFEEELSEEDRHHAGRTYETSRIPELYGLISTLNTRVAKLFTGVDFIVEIGSIVRGNEKITPSGMHRDNEDGQYEGNRNAMVKYGVLMYLNSDFDGGEICYPELGIEYKPKPGVLLIHYAGNMHGVNNISNGTRYSMTSFVWGLGAKIVGLEDNS